MRKKRHTKVVHEGQYVAEVEVELIETDEGWSPYLSLEDANKLDDVRAALRRGDLDPVKVVSRFELWVCRFQSADGFIHLTCGHWADHGNCIEHRWTEEEEKLEHDPEAWSFHIHLGLLAEGNEGPSHWKNGDRFCAFGTPRHRSLSVEPL